MTHERYSALMNAEAEITPEEMAEGWHFCQDTPYVLGGRLLVGPGMDEFEGDECDFKREWSEGR